MNAVSSHSRVKVHESVHRVVVFWCRDVVDVDRMVANVLDDGTAPISMPEHFVF